MPSHRHHNNGNLYIKLNVKFPDTLSTEQMAALEKALPPRKPLEKINPKHEVEEVFLEEPTDRQRSGAEAMDEDDDEDMRGGPGVQCAQRKLNLPTSFLCSLLISFAFQNRVISRQANVPRFGTHHCPLVSRLLHAFPGCQLGYIS